MERQAGNDGGRQVELVVTHRGGVCLRVSVSEHGGRPSSRHTANEEEVEEDGIEG